MKHLLFILTTAVSIGNSLQVFGQQWVHIPDPYFRDALQDPSTLTPSVDLSLYFNGDSLDVSSSVVQGISHMNVSIWGILDLTGITHFSGLIELTCFENDLTTIPPLPNSLEKLNCESNALVSIPSLPNSLQELNCHWNNLETLPALPESLTTLQCDDNDLHSLPSLPASLLHLHCVNNQLECLPLLPQGLVSLSITGNSIACLPNMPPNVYPWFFIGLPLCNISNIYDCEAYNRVTGKVFMDNDFDCSADIGELELGGRIVSSDNGSHSISDSLGHYILYLDTGTHTITQQLPSNGLWEFNCPSIPYTIEFDTLSDSIPDINFPNQVNEACPWLTVSLSSWAQRPCFSTNSYHLSYCNLGTAPAFGAYIKVELPPEITPLNGSMPWTDLGNGSIRFELGNLNVGECGSLYFINSVDCNAPLGYTVCASAEIFPISPCFEADPGWDGSSITITAQCVGNNVEFTITNVGTGNMSAPSSYRIYEEAALYQTDTQFQLNAGQSLNVTVPATGQTYLLSADQVPGHAGISTPQAWVEGCGTPVQLSEIWFTQDDQADHVDIECTELSAAYDPNDKTVVPSGYGAENNITMTDTLLEYRIRFQNTGSDTAFNIVVVDTLPLQELDITAFASGASSHPYWVEIHGEGIVSWHFDNIQLPDSNVNEPLSHGFVTFKINRFSDLQEGTVINNSASIYFDFNEPIITNTSFVTLSEPVVIESIEEFEFNLGVHPNPVRGVTRLVFDEVSQGTLVVKDSHGRIMITKPVTGTANALDLSLLESGIYIITLEGEHRPLGAAKVTVLR